MTKKKKTEQPEPLFTLTGYVQGVNFSGDRDHVELTLDSEEHDDDFIIVVPPGVALEDLQLLGREFTLTFTPGPDSLSYDPEDN